RLRQPVLRRARHTQHGLLLLADAYPSPVAKRLNQKAAVDTGSRFWFVGQFYLFEVLRIGKERQHGDEAGAGAAPQQDDQRSDSYPLLGLPVADAEPCEQITNRAKRVALRLRRAHLRARRREVRRTLRRHPRR